MWRFSIAAKQQIEGFSTTVKPYQIKTSKIAPKANSSGDVGRFSIFKSKFANRAAGKEVMRMPPPVEDALSIAQRRGRNHPPALEFAWNVA